MRFEIASIRASASGPRSAMGPATGDKFEKQEAGGWKLL
jgi:hypothetical protein